MAKQYWVGEFYVDLSRNQISQLGQSKTLPPKALLVLTQLAKNPGKVISYDEFLDEVWPNTIVTPNTLQRCIAQLRKALEENSQAQSIIKTHAKQGYSLECDVNWSQATFQSIDQQDNETLQPKEALYTEVSQPSIEKTESPELQAPKNRKSFSYLIWTAAFTAILVLLIGSYSVMKKEPKLQLGELRYITATDDKEFGGTYSPDGQFIIFRRYTTTGCINNIWAKTTDTLEEVRLTAQQGTYGMHSLSPDGKTLAFIQEDDCTKPVNQTTCYKLMSIDFTEALLTPQISREHLDCQNSSISKPVWIDNQNVVMMQTDGQQRRLIRYSMVDQSSSILYELVSGRLLNFAWSAEQQVFAVISIRADGKQFIDTLRSDGTIKSSHQIYLPESAFRFLQVHPEFIPNQEKLFFVGGGKFFTLSYTGQVEVADFQLDENAGGPSFHPDGNRVLMIKGTYDSDVATLTFGGVNPSTQQQDKTPLSVFQRSTNHEDIAKFQPDGDAIAFVSARTGIEQLWLLENDRAMAISHFSRGTFIRNLFWDDKGSSILALEKFELWHLALDKQINESAIAIDFPYPIFQLFDWDSSQHIAVANIQVNGEVKFVSIDLNSSQFQIINDKTVTWAAKYQDDSLIFTDHMGRFWHKTQIEDKLINSLTGLLGRGQRFVVSNDIVYGVNKASELWSYDLSSDELLIIADLTEDIDYITDIKNNEMLVTFVVAAKKEVIELSLIKPEP